MTGIAQNISKRTELVRQEAHRLGFDGVGFARARRLEREESRLEQWLKEGRHGSMQWMENHFDKRVDPRKLVPGARSVVSVMISYHQPDLVREQLSSDQPKISKYAAGDDYHKVVKEKLFELFAFTESVTGKVEGRVFVDTAPVLDKAWAVEAGIGWLGKHTNVLSREWGSWYFLGEMILDAEFDYDEPVADHCGSCTRCIDACPTDAIYEPYKMDGSKCISYFTIELRDEIPEEYHRQMGEWIFGCDICQDVCPWNSKARRGSEERLFARPESADKDIDYWEELNLQEYRELFRKSTVKRAKFDGLKRNIRIAAENVRSRDMTFVNVAGKLKKKQK
ncbi:tRNA epoxyqueuosine(34) reductase QueG [Natronogracilivirga saccharolytica]|uniref:Epoxyqueuosine reductase n=1 Tax=Natronogracilivirga saccharolytica TaxID=2812953 RepID=A0A8J7S9V6_9BACT|nr:tRNA epoxyqueuosine(34) reductase QueG [Natronogracilivirga saccharolytica]MBP3193088.1 tRNA epoxyqueuosine(34) reductase QueG [Natronogracilivirga saccharolytica]